MKIFVYGIAILLASFGYGCRSGHGNLSLSTTDTKTEFKFIAEYDEDKTNKIEKYLDSALNNDLPLDQNIDLLVNLNSKEKFNFKAKRGRLEISFDKRNNSLAGYMKVKKLAQGIQQKLLEK